jgi:hypothetical protein
MRVLNIGAGPKGAQLPPLYDGWEVVRLDVEPRYEPDLLMDALDLDTLEAGQFDATYASHLLEHIYPTDLKRFMAGVRHVLTDDGFAEFIVPDALGACRIAVQAGSLDAFCYESPAGTILAWDMLYGYMPYQEYYGKPMCHHNGFDRDRLTATLREYGFPITYSRAANLAIDAIGCKTDLSIELKRRMGIVRATGERGPVHPDAGAADVGTVRQLRSVAELPLSAAPRDRGNGDPPAEVAADSAGADLPGARSAARRLRLPMVHRPGCVVSAVDSRSADGMERADRGRAMPDPRPGVVYADGVSWTGGTG